MNVDRTSLMIARVHRTSGAERGGVERELALAYQRHPARRQEIASALTPLALSALQRYRYAREPREDLEQVAMVGLLKALTGFDPSRSRSFAAYAYPTVRGEVRRHFRDTGWAVHVPRETKQRAVAIRRLEREAGTTLADDDLAELLDVSESAVRSARRAGMGMFSESLPEATREAEPSLRVPGVEEAGYARAEDRATAHQLMRGLLPDECELLGLRFREDLSQRRIGEIMGLSQMQVGRRLHRTLDRITESVGA